MDNKEIKIAMVMAVSKALGYKHELEELKELDKVLDVNLSAVYQKILPEIEQTKDKKTRIAIIAAISKALKYLQENPAAEEKQVLQHVVKEADSVLATIDQFG